MNENKIIEIDQETLEDLTLFCAIAATEISERQRGDALLNIGSILQKLGIDFKSVRIYHRLAGEMKDVYMEVDECKAENPITRIHSSYHTYVIAGGAIVISSN